ncbi:hypothetical protein FB451DRAFT_560706 [Mycena latifolia]|nr:hypothetical protein FB451DRAFT_560706 [Mycena latifolia]
MALWTLFSAFLGTPQLPKASGRSPTQHVFNKQPPIRHSRTPRRPATFQGQVDALIYRALERNSGSVGAVTAPCTSIKAVNPEIAAIQQHQDPASDNAAAVNKAIVLELAKQIASVGGDPQDALKSGTFAPGTIGDPTAKVD